MCTYMYVCMNVCMYVSMHVYMYARMHVCMYASRYVCIHPYMHARIHAYIRGDAGFYHPRSPGSHSGTSLRNASWNPPREPGPRSERP